MEALRQQYIEDNHGHKIAIILPIVEYIPIKFCRSLIIKPLASDYSSGRVYIFV